MNKTGRLKCGKNKRHVGEFCFIKKLISTGFRIKEKLNNNKGEVEKTRADYIEKRARAVPGSESCGRVRRKRNAPTHTHRHFTAN